MTKLMCFTRIRSFQLNLYLVWSSSESLLTKLSYLSQYLQEFYSPEKEGSFVFSVQSLLCLLAGDSSVIEWKLL